jgi:hypothetical protein
MSGPPPPRKAVGCAHNSLNTFVAQAGPLAKGSRFQPPVNLAEESVGSAPCHFQVSRAVNTCSPEIPSTCGCSVRSSSAASWQLMGLGWPPPESPPRDLDQCVVLAGLSRAVGVPSWSRRCWRLRTIPGPTFPGRNALCKAHENVGTARREDIEWVVACRGTAEFWTEEVRMMRTCSACFDYMLHLFSRWFLDLRVPAGTRGVNQGT